MTDREAWVAMGSRSMSNNQPSERGRQARWRDVTVAPRKRVERFVSRELIQDAAQRLINIEVAAACGAGHGERGPGHENQRNGYWPRRS